MHSENYQIFRLMIWNFETEVKIICQKNSYKMLFLPIFEIQKRFENTNL